MNNKILLFVFLIACMANSSFSQCTEVSKPKVLLVGDSWAFFMNIDQTINVAFNKWGFSNYKYLTNSLIAENGAQTDDFLKPDKQNFIDSVIKKHPSIEVVHLTIGGNDVLGKWKKSFTQAQTDTLKNQVSARLKQIIDFIKTTRPGIRVLWSGYMYPNFAEILETSFLGGSHPYYSNWQKMEFPSFIQLNTVLNEFSADVEAYAATDPQVDFVNATGLLQYTFGQATKLAVAPGGSYAAFTQPLPAGDPTYPSPQNSMRDYLNVTKDCFHLSPKGYSDMLDYHTQKFYHKLLMDDLYLLSANNLQTGTASSLGRTVDSLVLGESAGEEFGTVLSFNTTTMVDTTLAKASVFLRRKSLSGSNPISSNLLVKVKSGSFGATVNVEGVDFADAGDGSGTPCLFGSNAGNDHWIRLDLPASVLPYINKNAITQIQISAPNFKGGKVVFNDATDPDFAPVLNLTYGETPSALTELDNRLPFKLYPNPVNEHLNIETYGLTINSVEVFDLLGKQIYKQNNVEGYINTTSFPCGMYAINIATNNGVMRQKFIKE